MGITALTLQIVDSGGLQVRLSETGNPGNEDVFSDEVILDATANLDFSLALGSNTDIAFDGSVTLTDADDDITLEVEITDTGLPTDVLPPTISRPTRTRTARSTACWTPTTSS